MDVDTGVDDALAILLAMNSPELEVLAITTVSGNTTVENATVNTLYLLELLSPDPPPGSPPKLAGGGCPLVSRGEAMPLQKSLHTAPQVHGEDGLGGVKVHGCGLKLKQTDTPAYQTLIEFAKKHPEEITVIATAPLTNLARAAQHDPEGFAKLKEIIIMGGAFKTRGNVTPFAEFNIFTDPHAAKIVFETSVPKVVVPLDVTEKCRLMRKDLDELLLGKKGTVPDFLRKLTDSWMRFHLHKCGFDGGYLHDPLAVGVCINPELVSFQPAGVYVETKDEKTSGRTVGNFSEIPTKNKVAVQVDEKNFLSFFLKRLSFTD